MAEQDYPILWSSPDDLGPYELFLAGVLHKALIAEIARVYQFGALSSREQRLLRKLMPRVPEQSKGNRADAFAILQCVEILRQAVCPPTGPDPARGSQAQQIVAEEDSAAQLDPPDMGSTAD